MLSHVRHSEDKVKGQVSLMLQKAFGMVEASLWVSSRMTVLALCLGRRDLRKEQRTNQRNEPHSWMTISIRRLTPGP